MQAPAVAFPMFLCYDDLVYCLCFDQRIGMIGLTLTFMTRGGMETVNCPNLFAHLHPG